MSNDRSTAVDGLVSLGLPVGPAKAYVTLLEFGSSEATPLAKLAGIPQPKIYGYLSVLEDKGLVSKAESIGRANLYVPTNYKLALEELQNKFEKNFSTTGNLLRKLQNQSKLDEKKHFVTVAQGERAVELGIKKIISEIKQNVILIESPFFSEFVNRELAKKDGIQVLRPIDELFGKYEGNPVLEKITHSFENYQSAFINRPLIMFRDIDFDKQICESVSLIVYQKNRYGMEEASLVIEITHQEVTKFQIRFFQTILGILEDVIKQFSK